MGELIKNAVFFYFTCTSKTVTLFPAVCWPSRASLKNVFDNKKVTEV